ncbi:MAG: tetratricopeptide repeat protein, partial [Bacteroidota bacterium]
MRPIASLLLLCVASFSSIAQLPEPVYFAKLDSLSEELYGLCAGQDEGKLTEVVAQYLRLAQQQDDLEEQFVSLDWKLYCASAGEFLGLYQQALSEMDSMLNRHGEQLADTSRLIRDITLNFFYGSYYHRFGNFSASRPYFLKTIEILDTHPENPLISYKSSSYRYLGSSYRQQGNTQAAIDLYQQARAENEADQNSADWGLYNKYLGDTYMEKQDDQTALRYYREALPANRRLWQDFPQEIRFRNRLVSTLHAMGRLFLRRAQSDSSLAVLRQAESLLPAESPALAETFQLLGQAYQQQNQYEQARSYLQLALAATELQYGRNSLAVGKNLRLMGDLFVQQDDPELALSFYQQSLQSLVPGFEQSDYRQNPSLSGLYLRKELLYTLRQKAYGLRKLATLQPKHPDALPEIAYETVQINGELN